MAEILVKAIDVTHPDPVKDRRGCYKRGNPVVVMEDGHEWGASEGLPKFYVIKFPGVPVADMNKYIEQWKDHSNPERAKGIQRRVWSFDLDQLDADSLNQLQTTGQLTISTAQSRGQGLSWGQLKQLLKNQQTNQHETVDL